jgi:hypothetical protein
MRGPGGPLTLREMSEEDVEPLFAPERPIRQSDKVLAFDLGTMVVGEHLLDRRLAFRQGESIIAQVSLSPPHEDMWVDCTLHDAVEKEVDGVVNTIPGKLITKAGQIVAREQFRGNFTFKLDEAFEPGEYLFRLRCGTEEVARRKFTLLPSVKSASAN